MTRESTRHPTVHVDAPVGWGAAIIDAQGNEIPITEGMIRNACDELSGSWVFPRLTDRDIALAAR